jgi:hypothetical protein
MRPPRFPAVILFALFLSCASLSAQIDLYSFPELESKPKVEEPKPVNPFLKTLAKKMDVPEQLLALAAEKGMGRMELIRLILISKKSGKPLTDLIQQREKLTRFAKIASQTNVDNGAIKKEARTLLKQIEKETEASQAIAGTVEPKENK